MGLVICSHMVQGFRTDFEEKSTRRYGGKWNKMEQDFIKGGL